MDEVIKEFLVESYENLDNLDRALIELEKDPRHKDSWNSIFRTVHTIKGTCGFLGFNRLQKTTHVGENLLSRLRDGKLLLNSEITTALLALVDAVRKELAQIEATEQESGAEYPELIQTLTQLAATEAQAPAVAPAAPPVPVAPSLPVLAEPPPPSMVAAVSSAIPAAPLTPSPVAGAEASQIPAAPVLPPPAPAPAPAPAASPADAKAPPSPSAPAAESRGQGVSESNVRVNVELLDKLMNLVGELVLARNQILQHTAGMQEAALVTASQRLSLITTELQESVMKTRMQPIGTVWTKLPRVVRDMANDLGKKVRFEMEGNETELDRTVIEAIKDPLTHIVRNSIDHGIEAPGKRLAAGKAEEGVLRMRAFHEGGQVNIEIIDDGGGIHTAKVKAKAVERGLISPEEAARMDERAAANLVFLPSLSTAEKITNVSGRGVGMDVVRTNIEKIGGSVDLQSEFGRGTTLRIKIPLTLAIIPALIVTSHGERYAIPQVNLLELVRLEGQEADEGIERILGAPVHRLRGNLLPLVYLNRELRSDTSRNPAHRNGAPPRPSEDSKEASETVVNIVVLQAGENQFGLIVDHINDTQEIVVKPLGKQFKGLSVYAGATILGDGRVALILDVVGLAQNSHVISKINERRLDEEKKRLESKPADDGRQNLLVFRLGLDGRLAMPLASVGRLEKFPLTVVEKEAGNEVVQYRGEIMRLLRLSQILGYMGAESSELDALSVVVYSEGGRSVGLVVDGILDIMEESVTLRTRGQRAGILGSAVIQGRVTEMLDAPAFVRSASPELFETHATYG